MSVGSMTRHEAKALALKLYGPARLYKLKGFWFVHLDKPGPIARIIRMMGFKPLEFFDPSCIHCKPFLECGCLMAYTEEGWIASRPCPAGGYDSVKRAMSRSGSYDCAILGNALTGQR